MAVVTNDPGILINGTYFDNFEALMQALALLGVDTYAIQQAGINTLELFKEALANEQIVPITTVREVIVGFAQVRGVDPATTTDVSTRVMTDVTVSTGGSVATYIMSGNKTLGLVSKVVAVGAVLSLLVAEVGAFLVPDEVQEDLITSADPYTIDHENIPVLIDDNGKTHFEADFIEAIRAKAIELGIFDIGPATPPEEMTSDMSYTNRYGNVTSDNVLQSASYNSRSVYTKRYNRDEAYYILNGVAYKVTGVKFNGATIFEIDGASVQFYVHTGGQVRITTVLFIRGDGSFNETAKLILDGTTTKPEPSGLYHVYNANYNGTITEGRFVVLTQRLSAASDIQSFYDAYDIPITAPTVSSYPTIAHMDGYFAYKYGTGGGGGVEGITPAADLINAGIADTTKSIAEVIPALGNGEEISSPTVSDLLNKGVWYPISILKENVFTEGATETDTSSAPNGDVSPEMEPDILDKIKELIEEALRDPDNPDAPVQPTIPVGDSGDTPPANPPLISGTGNGLWGIYNPSLSDVQTFGSWLWSSNIVDQIMRMFNSPIEAVIGFHMIYCTPIEGSVENIKCGFLDSGVPSPTVANQYVTIDCGTIDIPEYYHTALDYVATKLMLYLPFIGMIPLSTEVCMGSQLKVIYRIDVLTGTCLAQVKVIKNNSDATMYAFPGNCAVQIPLTATTYTGMVGVLISGSSAVGSLLSGNLMSAVRHGANALASGINNLSGTQQSGSLGSNSGALGPRKPYLIITHPVAYDAIEYNTQYGYPINKTVTLGSLTGYTRVKDIHLSGIPCTDNELELIEQLLKEGVIIN